jgi:hypothetical protein
MSRFAIPALISGTAFGVIFGLDTYAVGVLAPADLPDYAAARSLVMPMTLVPFAIGVVLMPRIAAATARQRRDLTVALAATVGASVLAVVAYTVLGDWLVALVYPDGFAGAAAFLTPLATALAVVGVYSVATQWSFGLGESRRPAAAIVAGALAVVGQIVLTRHTAGPAAAAITLGAGVALAWPSRRGGPSATGAPAMADRRERSRDRPARTFARGRHDVPTGRRPRSSSLATTGWTTSAMRRATRSSASPNGSREIWRVATRRLRRDARCLVEPRGAWHYLAAIVGADRVVLGGGGIRRTGLRPRRSRHHPPAAWVTRTPRRWSGSASGRSTPGSVAG